ncbi:MAG: HAD family hydrolase [Candidatus Azotimanducaceae bacterium]
MIKVIGFDLDDTLWDVAPVIRNAEKTLSNWIISRFPQVKYGERQIKRARKKILQEDPTIGFQFTRMRKAILKEIFEASLKDSLTAEKLSQEGVEIFIEARSEVDLYPGVEQTLKELAQNYELGIITNGNADITKLRISKYFSFSISAEKIGVPKPQPEIFLAALEETEVYSNEFVYVGDDVVNDIDGAKNVGMATVWKRNNARQLNGNTVPDKVIDCIGALPKAIKEIVNGQSFR